MSSSLSKRARNHPAYELLYHPAIPGRGEYVRLAFEATQTPYSDPANEDGRRGYARVRAACDPTSVRDNDGNPPIFSPPALRVYGAGKEGKNLVIHQTPNILMYLGPRIGLAPEDESDQLYANQIMLTALDVGDAAHDTHHPIAVALYYEDQKEESLRKATDFRENRIPKFFSYFERILKGNQELGQGRYLVGDKLSYADTTFWQVVDGLRFAFPNEMKAREREFPLIFGTFYPSFKEQKGVKEYLASSRRLAYSMGIYRHYPELDRAP